MIIFFFLCINRAFDTLAKVLHPAEGSAGESLEATMQLMSGDQSGPVVELEGSLLSESHFPFKVNNSPWSSGGNFRSELLVLCVSGCVHIHFHLRPPCGSAEPVMNTAGDDFCCRLVRRRTFGCQSHVPAIWHQHEHSKLRDSPSHNRSCYFNYVRPPLAASQPCRLLTQRQIRCDCSLTRSPFSLINTEFLFSPLVLPAYDAFARAWVPQCQLHLWISFQATFSLYALGALYSRLSDPQVRDLCRYMPILY